MAVDEFNANDGNRLRKAISAWCDGAITGQELEWLEATLSKRAEARRIFIASMSIHAGVQGEVVARQYVESVVRESFDPSLPSKVRANAANCELKPRRFDGRATSTILAASLLLVSLTAVLYFTWGRQSDDSSVAIGRIVHETVGSEWSVDHDRNSEGKVIYCGSMVRVASGSIKLQFNNRSVLSLHAPALYEVVSEMQGRALLGKLTAKIAKGAEGYSVLTPRATVIDLGTELGIDVADSGATDVIVFEGLVDLNYQPQHGNAARQRLSSGEGMHLDAYGTVSRIVSISNSRFNGESVPTPSRPAIISSVRDNIQRAQAWNYYEIVHAGMSEDARAFVDRTAHEWNGVDSSGMPKYLIGGDYVKTFNNDKCLKDIEIILSVEAPCKLYILFDDRIPPPKWLRKNFVPTGDKIGVDVGPWTYNNVASQGVEPAIGPGESIDDVMSIWVQDVEHPGPIKLGATETPHDDLNMYGIVVVPLDLARDLN